MEEGGGACSSIQQHARVSTYLIGPGGCGTMMSVVREMPRAYCPDNQSIIRGQRSVLQEERTCSAHPRQENSSRRCRPPTRNAEQQRCDRPGAVHRSKGHGPEPAHSLTAPMLVRVRRWRKDCGEFLRLFVPPPCRIHDHNSGGCRSSRCSSANADVVDVVTTTAVVEVCAGSSTSRRMRRTRTLNESRSTTRRSSSRRTAEAIFGRDDDDPFFTSSSSSNGSRRRSCCRWQIRRATVLRVSSSTSAAEGCCCGRTRQGASVLLLHHRRCCWMVLLLVLV